MQVIPLFSTPLLHVNIGALDPIKMAWVNSLEYPDLAVADNDFNFLDKPQLKELKQKINKHLDYFVYELLDVNKNITFNFQSSWLNRMDPGEHISTHSHKNSLVSGVYYMQDTNSAINFLKGSQHLNTWPTTVEPATNDKIHNQYTIDHFSVYPKAGDLLIFPSHLEHNVERNIDNNYRYSLAFNLFASGTIGTDSIGLTI